MTINALMFCVQVGGGLFQSAVKDRRHTLPQLSNYRRNPESHNSYSFQQRPKTSVNTLERFNHHPDQKKDRLEKRDRKISHCSNMSLQKVQFKLFIWIEKCKTMMSTLSKRLVHFKHFLWFSLVVLQELSGPHQKTSPGKDHYPLLYY